MRKHYSYEDMIATVEEYYETAGFKDIYERELKYWDRKKVEEIFYSEVPEWMYEDE